ncbi:hypothetical protein [Candidatus Merdisoma sp. JLR.KK006]|uniref:hypothetical protein n=1 Tax=Candidatus Merdisoma sp. JLR.KK006 TaxID=3112626 RepID=UPI002FEE875C
MKRQPKWDKYEVALLIEAYLNIKNGNRDKIEALQELSNHLREKAINEGMEIDETFRNLNGMRWQMEYIDCAFKKAGYGKHMPSKLFQSIVDMYLEDEESFKKILNEAKLKIGEKYLDMDTKNIEEEKNGIANRYETRLIQLVAEKFVYGFRLGSVIELMKLKKYAQEENIDIKEVDEEIIKIIKQNGFVSNGKVFIVNDAFKKEINGILAECFEQDISIIYYECFMEIHRDWLEIHHIVTENILKEFLIETKKDLFFAKNYFSKCKKTTEHIAVTNEIYRIWGDEIKLSVEEISNRLPYIPIEKIRFYLTISKLFVWISEGVYTCVKTLIVTEEEEKEIVDFVSYECKTRGFTSLSDIPLGDIIEENYELSKNTILNAIYNKILSNEFYLNGKIITKGKKDIDVVTLMKKFCVEKEECTFDEAMNKVNELIGVKDQRAVYLALYDTMIRVNKEKFVADRLVCFDIDAIDYAIEPFIKGGFAAIKEVTTFALFPICGQTWNHYLLESYCYKYSKKYRYRANLLNGRNVGAIVACDINWDYKELLSHVAAQANIKLEKEQVGKYLFDTGYMARSKFNWLDDIIDRAKQIREGKE